jgi:type VI secretion system secreted protein Hcp
MHFSRLISFAATTTIAATLAVVPAANAADQYFLKLDGVTGEATTTATPGLVELKSFEWGAENAVTLGSYTGAGSGKTTILQELTIEKNVDSTSPVLFQKLSQGTAIPGMELVVRHVPGPTAAPIYQRYQFQPVYVTSQTQGAATGDSAISEKLVFTYGAVKMGYTKQSTSGTTVPANTVTSSWNQITKLTSMVSPGFPDTSNVFRINN